jgi:membrane protein implicated in regulation of membrane protease activity
MQNLLRRAPTWALVAGAAVVVALVILALVTSVYVGVVLVLFALLGVAGYLAWTRLPERFEEGPDDAERRELEKHREAMEEEEREREEKQSRRESGSEQD